MGPPLAAADVLSILSYSPETGELRWLSTGKGRKRAEAGCLRRDGYRLIRINKRLYLAHRLAWLVTYGVWPSEDIDHINGVRSDNRIANLRDVPRRVNLENQRSPRSDNKSGALGVTKWGGRFLARIQVRGSSVHLGSFGTVEDASAAYLSAKKRLHEGCALGDG